MTFPDITNVSLTTQDDQVRVLGQTGKTVVYLFPDGRAVADRERPDLESLEFAASTHPAASIPGMVALDSLIQEGTLTTAQKTVVLHDHEKTGMSVIDILTARGWL